MPQDQGGSRPKLVNSSPGLEVDAAVDEDFEGLGIEAQVIVALGNVLELPHM